MRKGKKVKNKIKIVLLLAIFFYGFLNGTKEDKIALAEDGQTCETRDCVVQNGVKLFFDDSYCLYKAEPLYTVEEAERLQEKLLDVTLPDWAQGIRAYAFCEKNAEAGAGIQKKTELIRLNIPHSVKLEPMALYGLTVREICYDAKVIEMGTFEYVQADRISLGDNTVQIREKAFHNCIGLKEISLGKSLMIIESRAFSRVGIERIEIPETVTKLGENIFDNCSRLKTVYLNSTAPQVLRDTSWVGKGKFTVVIPDTAEFASFYAYRMKEIPVAKGDDVCLNFTNIVLLAGDFDTRLFLCNTGGEKGTYRSSNKKVASVDADGHIKAMSTGYATVSVAYGGKTYKCKITVLKRRTGNRAVQLDRNYGLSELPDYFVADACLQWMNGFCRYDYSYSKAEAKDILLDGVGVCTAYTDGFCVLMNYFHIPTDTCLSGAGGNRMNHVWNYVKIGKEWYHLDATWGNFLMSDRQVQSSNSGQIVSSGRGGHYGYTKKYRCISENPDLAFRSERSDT